MRLRTTLAGVVLSAIRKRLTLLTTTGTKRKIANKWPALKAGDKVCICMDYATNTIVNVIHADQPELDASAEEVVFEHIETGELGDNPELDCCSWEGWDVFSGDRDVREEQRDEEHSVNLNGE